jgi:hypothetical protein
LKCEWEYSHFIPAGFFRCIFQEERNYQPQQKCLVFDFFYN